MSRYPTITDAARLSDGDTVRIGNARRTFTLSVLDGSRYANGSVALIPNATVVQAAHYGDLGRPDKVHVVDFGGAIHVQGFGCLMVVRTENPDWPRLVPAEGPRYYTTHESGASWMIRDRLNDGKPIDWGLRSGAAQYLFGSPRIDSRDQANAVAAYLSVGA